MKDKTKRAYKILKGLRAKIGEVNFKASSFLSLNGHTAEINPIKSHKLYKKSITLPKAIQDKITCCLAGMIPMVDWEWAKEHDMNFAEMSTEISFTLHRKNTMDDKALWDWLFSSKWNNNTSWAKERLNLVIKKKKCYGMIYGKNYNDVHNMQDFFDLTLSNKEKSVHTYLLKGNKDAK